jgi:hypothetical protein
MRFKGEYLAPLEAVFDELEFEAFIVDIDDSVLGVVFIALRGILAMETESLHHPIDDGQSFFPCPSHDGSSIDADYPRIHDRGLDEIIFIFRARFKYLETGIGLALVEGSGLDVEHARAI